MSIATFSNLGGYGELGNQMFQVAAVYGYAKKCGKTPIFPVWQCKFSGTKYGDIFKNPVNQQLAQGTYCTPFQYMNLTHVEIPCIENNVDLVGYFQSEKYFVNCEEEIRDLFTPNDEILNYIQTKYADILSVKNKVSLHVRTCKRGNHDYDVHSSATLEFIEKCQSHFPDAELYVVFADNVEVAKTMLPAGKNYHFIENEANYVDLFLMTMFDSYIVSPSTFGWWGAWLSKSKDPKVVIMKDWFAIGKAKEYLNINNDQVPDRWTKI